MAEVIALACSSLPEVRKRWSIRLMVEALKKEEGLESINREVVRIILKKRLNHGKEELYIQTIDKYTKRECMTS